MKNSVDEEIDNEIVIDFEQFSENVLNIIEQYINSSDEEVNFENESNKLNQSEHSDINDSETILVELSNLVLSEYISNLISQFNFLQSNQNNFLDEELNTSINVNTTNLQNLNNSILKYYQNNNFISIFENQPITSPTGFFFFCDKF